MSNPDMVTADSARTPSHSALAVGVLTILLTLAIVASQSMTAVVILLVDGAPAIALLATASLAGTWIIPLLRIRPIPLCWRLLIGAGCGIAALSTLVLVCGVLGWLGRGTWLAVFTVLTCAAVGALLRLRHHSDASASSAGAPANPWLWLIVTPFLAMTLLVAVVPPGFLWAEEGGGYDVLEYHLELPKEYLAQGRITYTPRNVYGNFPENVEMLYLLSMILRNDPYDGAATAKVLNAAMGMLFVFAAYVAGRETSRPVGAATAVVAAGVGWLTYLSGIAYVENGVLMFAMIALAGVLRAAKQPGAGAQRRRWLVLSGLMAGAACGCKYTALLLIAAPLVVTVALLPQRTLAPRIRSIAMFGVACIVGFAPWLIKNVAQTGNPVFPLLSAYFDAQPPGWGEREALHFDAAHAPGPDEASTADRFRLLWQRILADPVQRFGPLLLILPVIRLWSARRQRIDVLLAVMTTVQLFGWLFATHLYARFAVPIIVPLVVLAGRAFDSRRSPTTRRLLVGTLIVGSGISAANVGTLYVDHLYHAGRKLPLEGADRFFLDGLGGGYEHLSLINRSLPDDARILMIGDAKAFYFRRDVDYCVVFNRNPFVEAVRTAHNPSAIVEWLREKGYTHVLVNWAEIIRLRNSRYGFPEEIRPDLFTRLSAHGIRHVATFRTGDPPAPYADLYSVSR